MFGLDGCYLEWRQICRASESASDVKSCDLYESIDRQWCIKDTVYHVGVTSVEDLTLTVFHIQLVKLVLSPWGFEPLVLLVRSKAIQPKG